MYRKTNKDIYDYLLYYLDACHITGWIQFKHLITFSDIYQTICFNVLMQFNYLLKVAKITIFQSSIMTSFLKVVKILSCNTVSSFLKVAKLLHFQGPKIDQTRPQPTMTKEVKRHDIFSFLPVTYYWKKTEWQPWAFFWTKSVEKQNFFCGPLGIILILMCLLDWCISIIYLVSRIVEIN